MEHLAHIEHHHRASGLVNDGAFKGREQICCIGGELEPQDPTQRAVIECRNRAVLHPPAAADGEEEGKTRAAFEAAPEGLESLCRLRRESRNGSDRWFGRQG